ncbi:hypothetical protein [Saccharococcus caldoxylosilyticus]|uniref:hypothetical protein n=1 Tax=Saccharococcus caldoxylosilyticus TaxID=81408 RepID=UPI00031EB9B5|nr:hypothetical protein [Parageobacillus caldoxylosilyticus]
MMKVTIVEYAMILNKIGAKMVNISNRLKLGNNEELQNLQDLKTYYTNLETALCEYKQHQKELSSIVPPNFIVNEHNALVEAFDNFVKATQMLINSVNLNNLSVDKEEFQKGLMLQKSAELSVKTATDTIVEKVTNQ